MQNAEVRTKIGQKRTNILLRSTFCILTSALIFQSGCTTIGAVGGLVAQAVPREVDAAYKGLAGQTVIVMVWLDRGLKLDFPDLQLDIASSLQNKLIDQQQTEKPDELKGTEFPVMASTVIHYQDDHPEIDNEPITEVAGKFDGTRLIYLEIKDFATHAGAPELFRGTLKGDIKVLGRRKWSTPDQKSRWIIRRIPQKTACRSAPNTASPPVRWICSPPR